jgi:hypothetical protein
LKKRFEKTIEPLQSDLEIGQMRPKKPTTRNSLSNPELSCANAGLNKQKQILLKVVQTKIRRFQSSGANLQCSQRNWPEPKTGSDFSRSRAYYVNQNYQFQRENLRLGEVHTLVTRKGRLDEAQKS